MVKKYYHAMLSFFRRKEQHECQLCDNLCQYRLCDECNQLVFDRKAKYEAFHASEE